MQLLIGLNVGTTALKVAFFDGKGTLLAVSAQEYALLTPKVNYVEVGAEVYRQSLKKGLEEITAACPVGSGDKIALAISAQGETLICIDKQGKTLGNTIVWMDNQAVDEAQKMEERFGNETCYRVTGQISFEPCWPAPKILWLKKNKPETFANTDRFLLAEDYLICRMTGHFYTEGSLVCSSVYWDIINKCYWKDMLDFIGIRESQLAEVAESSTVMDDMIPEMAREFGLNCPVAVCMRALDQAAGAIGAGNIKEGMFSETIGVALAVCAPVSELVSDPNRRMPLHYSAPPDIYMTRTFTTGGMTSRWFRDKFCADEMAVWTTGGGDTYDLISSGVDQVAPGCDGLVMLPHLSSSLAPGINAKAKGVWFGFSLNHIKVYFARSIMESLGFILRRNLEALADMGVTVEEVRSLGGGSKSKVWNQIKANINDISLVTVKSKEAACLGATILAGITTGVFSSVEDAVNNMIQVKDWYEARPDDKELYDERYEMYRKPFRDLMECFDRTGMQNMTK